MIKRAQQNHTLRQESFKSLDAISALRTAMFRSPENIQFSIFEANVSTGARGGPW
jgi:hypothetical protein